MNRRLLTIAVALTLGGLAMSASASVTDAAEELVPQRYIIAFDGDPGLRAGDTYADATVLKFIEDLDFVFVETDNVVGLEAAALLDENVRYLTPDRDDWELYFVPNDPLYTHDAHWGSKRIGGEAAWDVTLGSTAVKVAMVDSGLNFGHEEFAGQSRVLQGFDFRDGDSTPEDTSGCNFHGTHTTSTAGSTTNNGLGIAGMSQHTILPVKIFGAGFFGCGTTTTAIIEALKYTGDQGAHLSSNSWGGGSSDASINDAIQYAHSKGVIHVAAAGNSGPCTNCVGQPWKDNPSITIVVSSLTDGDTFSSFSSEGPEVDVIAPGEFIAGATSGTSDYHAMSGTSMATPHVTGSLALYVAATGNTGYSTVEGALKSTAEDLGFSSDRQGSGLVRADSLVGGGGGGGGGNSAPTASFTFSCTDLSCSFDGTGSSDPDGDALSYSWDFGDGNTATGATASHTYGAAGDYTVTLTVSDGSASDTDSQVVSVTSGGGGGGDGISLSTNAYKVRGTQHVDLSWSGATSTDVDIYENGALLTTTANDGEHTHNRGVKGGGSADYQVCEAGTTTCSNVVTASW